MLRHPVYDSARVLELPRQDEVPYEHAGLQYLLLVHAVDPDLAEHLEYRGRRDLGVIFGIRILLRRQGQGILEVRHVYLHEALEHFERPDALVARAVPHDGDAELQPGQRLGDGPHEVRAGDEADVVHACVAQAEHGVAQFGHGELHASAGSYLVVLAVDAAQGAAGEEDGAAAARAADAGLLAEVRRGPGGAGQISRAAAALRAVLARSPAVSRAVMAGAQNSSASLVWP